MCEIPWFATYLPAGPEPYVDMHRHSCCCGLPLRGREARSEPQPGTLRVHLLRAPVLLLRRMGVLHRDESDGGPGACPWPAWVYCRDHHCRMEGPIAPMLDEGARLPDPMKGTENHDSG